MGGAYNIRKFSTYRRGLWAEALCRLALRLKGYRILGTRVRTPVGEIDIVAVRGRVIALVEVKARPTRSDGLMAITPRQITRLRRAASAYLGRHQGYADYAIRFDAMLVTPWRWPEHVERAWEGAET